LIARTKLLLLPALSLTFFETSANDASKVYKNQYNIDMSYESTGYHATDFAPGRHALLPDRREVVLVESADAQETHISVNEGQKGINVYPADQLIPLPKGNEDWLVRLILTVENMDYQWKNAFKKLPDLLAKYTGKLESRVQKDLQAALSALTEVQNYLQHCINDHLPMDDAAIHSLGETVDTALSKIGVTRSSPASTLEKKVERLEKRAEAYDEKIERYREALKRIAHFDFYGYEYQEAFEEMKQFADEVLKGANSPSSMSQIKDFLLAITSKRDELKGRMREESVGEQDKRLREGRYEGVTECLRLAQHIFVKQKNQGPSLEELAHQNQTMFDALKNIRDGTILVKGRVPDDAQALRNVADEALEEVRQSKEPLSWLPFRTLGEESDHWNKEEPIDDLDLDTIIADIEMMGYTWNLKNIDQREYRVRISDNNQVIQTYKAETPRKALLTAYYNVACNRE